MKSFKPDSIPKIDFAMDKLCRAYASDRISITLYRAQRAALIHFALNPAESFPDLTLNEYAQDVSDEFVPESTPVIDDLGFQLGSGDELGLMNISTGVAKPEPVTKIANIDTKSPNQLIAQRLEQFDEQEIDQKQSSFDQYYWLYLMAFVSAMCTFILFYIN